MRISCALSFMVTNESKEIIDTEVCSMRCLSCIFWVKMQCNKVLVLESKKLCELWTGVILFITRHAQTIVLCHYCPVNVTWTARLFLLEPTQGHATRSATLASRVGLPLRVLEVTSSRTTDKYSLLLLSEQKNTVATLTYLLSLF